MYEIKVISEFNAAHRLRGYRGECEKLHGHNWRVEAVGRTDKLAKNGLALDFRVFKKALADALKSLDHAFLNEIKPFNRTNPSSENIAKYIFDSLKRKPAIRGKLTLKKVSVWETSTSCATYRE